MSESTEPLSTSSPEVVTVDTGADKESIASITDSFADFWKEEDNKTEAPEEKSTDAPSAPGEGAAQETKVETPVGKPEPPSSAPAAAELSDEEIEHMQLPPTARPEHVADFRKMREQVIMARKQLRAEAAEKAKIEEQLSQARQNAWTPEQKADYEHASEIRRRFDCASDPEFVEHFHLPVQQRFESLLEEAVEVLPDREAARQWADHIKSNYRPDQLGRDWWVNDVVAKVPNELDRAQLLNSVSQLRQTQKARDSELMRRTNNQSAFNNFVAERATNTSKRVQEEIMTEIGVQEQRIAEILPRNIDEAKTSEERKAIEAHNERFARLNNQFQGFIKDISANGPRGWVRASIEATRAQILDEGLKELKSELKNAKLERDKYKSELDKIAGARRRLSQTTGTPPASNSKKNDGLSIRNLDVRQSFDKYWAENDGNT